MLDFEINNQTAVEIIPQKIKHIVAVFLSVKKWKKKKYFSLAFVNASAMQKMNNTYRGKNKPTDVLSFEEIKDEFIISPEEDGYLGEIIICLPVAKKQAKELGHSLEYEISRLLVHGLAHLSGYEHENVEEKEAEKMFRFEKKIMNKIKSF